MLGNQLKEEIERAIKVIEVDAKGSVVDGSLLERIWRRGLENIHARTLLGLVASTHISRVESRQLRKRFDA